MKKLFTAALIACSLSVFGQNNLKRDTLFFEDFESTKIVTQKPSETDWRMEKPIDTDAKWKLNNGGAKPTGSSVSKPESAHSGSKNAWLYYLSWEYQYNIYLVSPPIDLKDAHKPMLSFWYSQYADRANFTGAEVDNFEFSLHYRIGEGEWFPLGTPYTEPTDDSEPWRFDSIMLPKAVCGKKNVQIAFLGATKFAGHGCCIDDVLVLETDTIPKRVESITASHPSTNVIPTNSTDNAILRLRIRVTGNDGELNINSLTATALQQTSTVVKENSVKLFYTQTEFFDTDTPLGTTSIINDKATFNNINKDLPTGNNYLWITCDIKEDHEHCFRNNIVDMKIESGAININDSLYQVELDPNGNRIIAESIFIDNYEDKNKSDTIWTLGGEFERADAKNNGPFGGGGGNPNPSSGHSGSTYMLGTDITGLGVEKGKYEKGIGSNEYYAISKSFNCYYYKDISLMFYRWLNVCNSDTAAIGISFDGGTTWSNIWASSSVIQEKDWSFQYLNLNKVADRNPNVKIRFTLGPTRSGLAYSGWNIDDVALVGTYIYKDAALAEVVAPNTDCGLDTDEKVTIRIKNVGFNDINAKSTTEDSLFVSYSIDGREWVTDTVKEDIKRDAELLYTFKKGADLSKYGPHEIMVKVSLGMDTNGNVIDEDERNDYAQKRIMTLPLETIPYAQSFDSSAYWFGNADIWQLGRLTKEMASDFATSRNGGTWQYGKPSHLNSPGWYTNVADTTYAANDSSWLETPSFNMSTLQKPIIEFKLRGKSYSTDGLAVYYSIDNGRDWKYMPAYPVGNPHPNWKWYNAPTVAALGNSGWSGNYDDKWQTIKQLLPDEVAGKDSVRFRFVFASGKKPVGFKGIGFAIDDFRLYESPIDVGIAEIVEPVDACELLKEQPITVAITNFGLRGVIPTDSLIATIVINDKLTLTDTLFVTDTLAVGDTILHTFSRKVDMWNKKAYRMTAYTQAPGDTMRLFINNSLQLSGVENDTFKDTANVLGEPQYDLGADIGTLDPEKTILDGCLQTNSQNEPTDIPFALYQWYDNTHTAVGEYHWDDNGKDSVSNGTERYLYKLNKFPDDVDEYKYSIVVTNDAGCEATDTIKIIHSTIDVAITSVSGLEDDAFCINKEFEDIKVSVTVKNMSSVVSVTDHDFKIGIGYKILDADSNWVTYTDTIACDLNLEASEDTVVGPHPFVRQPKFEHNGPQNISFFTVIRADLDRSNNTDTVEVTVWPLPIVDLGDDIILSVDPKSDSVVLETNYIEGATYSWLNYADSVKNTFMVTDSLTKIYKVSVTDEHNCATVTDSVLVVTDDWALAELVSPANQCEQQSGMDVTVRLINNSFNKYGAGYRIPAVVNVNGGVQRDTIVLIDSVFAYDTVEYTLNAKADSPEIGAFPVKVDIMPQYDVNREDTSNTIYEYVNIWGIPRIDLGVDTIFTLQPETIVLDAGSVVDGTDFSWYKWNKKNEYKDQTYNVLTADNICYVFAMNEHGCYANDQKISIYDDQLGNIDVATDTVVIITADVEFDEIISPASSCDITKGDVLSIDIRNSGLSAIKNGTELPVKVKINDGEAKTVTFKLREQLKVGATTQLSMSFATDFESDKAYVVKTWLDWNLDHFNDNDTATITVSQFPHPNAFTLGDDIYTTQPDTLILRAPKDQYYYSWSNGVKGNDADTIELPNSASTNYSLRVFNEYNCETADTMSVYTYDLEFTAFTNKSKENSNHCEPIEDAVVYGKISVKSLDVIPYGTNMTANYNFNGKSDRFDVTLPTPINKDKPYTFSFKEKITVPDTGEYVMKTGLTVNNNFIEADTANYKETEFRIGTYQIPFKDTVSTYDNVYTIDAGNMFTIFDWYNEHHHDAQTLTVVKTGDYKLKATDINGCEAEDSTFVLFIKPRYEVAKIEFDTLLCENAEPSTIAFYLKNTGNDIISTGSQAEISYMTNDSVLNEETFTFNKTIKENDSILITFNKLADFAKVGVDSVRIKAIIAGHEALKTVAVTTKANPKVSLGDDFATTNTDTIITAGAGFAEYLWNTGETAAGISISKDGNYWVKVRDEFGCENADTVHAHFIPATITVTRLLSPVSACGSIAEQPIAFEILNNSKTIVKKGQKIGVTCIVDNLQKLNYSAILADNFAPSAVYNDTTGKCMNITEVGVHTLKFITEVDGVANDTAEFNIEVYSLPELSFAADTIKTEEYPYVLKANVLTDSLMYMWSTNETTDSIFIGTDSTYTLKVTDSHGCWALDSVVVRRIEKIVPPDTTHVEPPDTTPVVRPGISVMSVANIAIYPNPTDNILNIDFGGVISGNCRILIANATGQIIFASKQTSDIMQINVIDWADGMYFIKVEGNGGTRILKFVKQ